MVIKYNVDLIHIVQFRSLKLPADIMRFYHPHFNTRVANSAVGMRA